MAWICHNELKSYLQGFIKRSAGCPFIFLQICSCWDPALNTGSKVAMMTSPGDERVLTPLTPFTAVCSVSSFLLFFITLTPRHSLNLRVLSDY